MFECRQVQQKGMTDAQDIRLCRKRLLQDVKLVRQPAFSRNAETDVTILTDDVDASDSLVGGFCQRRRRTGNWKILMTSRAWDRLSQNYVGFLY